MKPRDELTMNDYQALAEFRYQIRRFLHFSEQIAREAGLEPLQIQHHSTVELIDRMVERDLIERNRDDEDQRRVIIKLTSAGEEVLSKLSLLHHTELQTTGPSLVQSLNRVIDAENEPVEIIRDRANES